jgi:hypothetical protein
MGEFTIKAPVGLRVDGSPAANEPRDVKVVQFLLNVIPASAGAPAALLPTNGVLTQETLDGIASFQQQQLGFVDRLVEPGRNTIKFMNREQTLTPVGPAAPFTNEELRSWAIRKLPEWNFTRREVAASLPSGLSFSPASQALLPPAYQANIAAAIFRIAEPTTSDPSSWGVSPFDLYHVHLLVPSGTAADADVNLKNAAAAFSNRMSTLLRQAADGGLTIDTPAQATRYKMLLQGMTPDYRRHLMAASQRPGIRLEYHSFEHDRPTGMQSDDPRRSWRSLSLNHVPVIERSEFHATSTLLGAHLDVGGLAFLVDKGHVVHVVPGSGLQLTAIAEVPEADLR